MKITGGHQYPRPAMVSCDGYSCVSRAVTLEGIGGGEVLLNTGGIYLCICMFNRPYICPSAQSGLRILRGPWRAGGIDHRYPHPAERFVFGSLLGKPQRKMKSCRTQGESVRTYLEAWVAWACTWEAFASPWWAWFSPWETWASP